MLRKIRFGRQVYRRFHNASVRRQSFLPEEYSCESAWQKRLSTPLLQKINIDKMLHDLELKFQNSGTVSAVDVDIFANTIHSSTHTEDLLHLLHNLRSTHETSNTLDSTHHAVIRFLLSHNLTTELMNVLYNRLTYGIFPDHMCYNMLMNHFLKQKEYGNAAQIAALPMLQEDSDHPITNAFAMYCCHMYLTQPGDWKEPEVPVEEDSGEEIKVRVNYLRNPYFDDHFDLTHPSDLIGKTLAFYGKNMGDTTLGRSCRLRGLMLYQKYEDAIKLVEQWKKDIKENVVHQEVFELITKDNQRNQDKFLAAMSEVKKLQGSNLCTSSIIEELEKNLKSAIEEHSQKDISLQCQAYDTWNNNRQTILDNQLDEIKKTATLEEINKIKKDLLERERLLTFFENEEKIEMEIANAEAAEKKDLDYILKIPKVGKKLKKLGLLPEDYTPAGKSSNP